LAGLLARGCRARDRAAFIRAYPINARRQRMIPARRTKLKGAKAGFESGFPSENAAMQKCLQRFLAPVYVKPL